MRKKLLTLLIGVSVVVALVTVPLMTACAPEAVAPEAPEAPQEVAPKVVKIGFLNALTGPCALWGLPGLTGLNIWMDKVNDAGGLKVGDERYLVELIAYDNEDIPSKTLLGAKKLVLEDGVEMIHSSWGASTLAIQPFLTEHKILNFPSDHYII